MLLSRVLGGSRALGRKFFVVPNRDQDGGTQTVDKGGKSVEVEQKEDEEDRSQRLVRNGETPLMLKNVSQDTKKLKPVENVTLNHKTVLCENVAGRKKELHVKLKRVDAEKGNLKMKMSGKVERWQEKSEGKEHEKSDKRVKKTHKKTQGEKSENRGAQRKQPKEDSGDSQRMALKESAGSVNGEKVERKRCREKQGARSEEKLQSDIRDGEGRTPSEKPVDDKWMEENLVRFSLSLFSARHFGSWQWLITEIIFARGL